MFLSLLSTSLVLLLLQQQQQTNALDNGLALTPPMGWISWVRFTCETNCTKYPNECIESKLFESMADRIVADGYKEAGYKYVNIDDCWMKWERDLVTQRLVPDRERFPNGIRGLADYIHGKGLQIGTYGDCGIKTCQGYPAQLKTLENVEDNYFEIDAETFSEWQIDSFKFDGCYMNNSIAESICPKMAVALNSTKRPMLLTCEWPVYMIRDNLKPNYEIAAKSCNTWRYLDDVEDSWASIQLIIDLTVKKQYQIVKYHGPGQWFDPDMLVIGNYGLSLSEARTQMAIWAIWSAPLYMSNDLRKMDSEMAKILKNKLVIEVNQDRLGIFGLMVADQDEGEIQAFAKPIEPIRNGCPSFAIVYLNRKTLGKGQIVSFPIRKLLKSTPLSLASSRQLELYGDSPPGGHLNISTCWERLDIGMTEDLDTAMEDLDDLNGETPLAYKTINYKVTDLFKSTSLGSYGLNSTLDLFVEVSGVRIVTLIEII